MSHRAVFQSPDEILPHAIYGDWSIPEITAEYAYLPLIDVLRKIRRRSLRRVEFSLVCAKPVDWHGRYDFAGPRYDAADVRYPGMIVKDMPNPCDLPYRMIDGRRRMHKLRAAGKSSGNFIVFDYTDVLPFIVEVIIDPAAGHSAASPDSGEQKRLLDTEYADKRTPASLHKGNS